MPWYKHFALSHDNKPMRILLHAFQHSLFVYSLQLGILFWRKYTSSLNWEYCKPAFCLLYVENYKIRTHSHKLTYTQIHTFLKCVCFSKSVCCKLKPFSQHVECSVLRIHNASVIRLWSVSTILVAYARHYYFSISWQYTHNG